MKRFFMLALTLVGILAGCSAEAGQPGTEHSETEDVCKAMYVPLGQDSYIMVGQENGSVFTVSMPEEIYNLSGEKIAAADLKGGNILEITGDGVMLESYPGQYPGVTKIRVLQEGDLKDTEQYQHIIDELYVEPDPSEPPSLQIQYEAELYASCAVATRGGYQWNWVEDEAAGVGRSAIACGAHILEWQQINDVALEKASRLELHFSRRPDSVSVHRWAENWKGSGSGDIPEGETVEVLLEEDRWMIDGEPGYIYLVDAVWEEGSRDYGSVEYGFMA